MINFRGTDLQKSLHGSMMARGKRREIRVALALAYHGKMLKCWHKNKWKPPNIRGACPSSFNLFYMTRVWFMVDSWREIAQFDALRVFTVSARPMKRRRVPLYSISTSGLHKSRTLSAKRCELPARSINTAGHGSILLHSWILLACVEAALHW